MFLQLLSVMFSRNLLGKLARHGQKEIVVVPIYVFIGELTLCEKKVYENVLIIFYFQPHEVFNASVVMVSYSCQTYIFIGELISHTAQTSCENEMQQHKPNFQDRLPPQMSGALSGNHCSSTWPPQTHSWLNLLHVQSRPIIRYLGRHAL